MVRAAEKIVFAVTFGALYLVLTAFIPYDYYFHGLECWDITEDFLWAKDHLTLVFCAALAGLAVGSMKTDGWKGFAKTAFIAYACFQLFSVREIYDFIFVKNCFFPLRPDEIPLFYYFSLPLAMLIVTAYWTAIGVGLLIVYKRVWSVFIPPADDLQKPENDD
jgi:hypothetical protein